MGGMTNDVNISGSPSEAMPWYEVAVYMGPTY